MFDLPRIFDPLPTKNLDLLSKLLDFTDDDKSKPEPDFGDVIYVDRIFYKHFGIYIGKRKVIHYANDVGGKLCIHEAPIAEFLDGASDFYACDFPKNYGRPSSISIQSLTANSHFSLLGMWLQNNKRNDYHLYSPAETVKRARQRLGETKYNLIFNNCEHFALWCKTGLHESHQVEDFFENLPKTSIGI